MPTTVRWRMSAKERFQMLAGSAAVGLISYWALSTPGLSESGYFFSTCGLLLGGVGVFGAILGLQERRI